MKQTLRSYHAKILAFLDLKEYSKRGKSLRRCAYRDIGTLGNHISKETPIHLKLVDFSKGNV